MSAIVETLRRARKLLTPEGAWTQKALARNRVGRSVDPDAYDAVCWCASGAIGKVLGNPDLGTDNDDLWMDALVGLCPSDTLVPVWNDSPARTHAEVLAAFDEAIRRAEAS